MAGLTQRIRGAVALRAATYEEVEADATATPQAVLVVVLAALAGGVSAIRATGVVGLVLAGLASLLGWYVWAFVTFLVGTRLLPGARTEADLGQLLRTIGFSAAPGVVRVLGIVPVLDRPVSLLASLWMLAAMVVAVCQALDYDTTGRAVAVCVVGFVLNFVLLMILGTLVGVPVIVAP